MHKQIRQIGFTIVELLIVVVVIGILAALVVTAWNGITQRSKDSALAADLSQAKKQIEAFYAVNGSYPTANNCTNTAATEICLKTSPGNTLTYTFNGNTASPPYTLTGNNGVLTPTITSISPSSGSTAGGTSVVITGTNMTGATAVTFGGTAATSFTVNSATQITATTPAKTAGAVSVAVTTAGGTATSTNAFTYNAPSPPTFTSISPTSGTYGTVVTITGNNFITGSLAGFQLSVYWAGSFTVINNTTATGTIVSQMYTGPTDIQLYSSVYGWQGWQGRTVFTIN